MDGPTDELTDGRTKRKTVNGLRKKNRKKKLIQLGDSALCCNFTTHISFRHTIKQELSETLQMCGKGPTQVQRTCSKGTT